MKDDGSSADYYKLPQGAKDLMDLIELKNMDYGTGNIFKAAFRLGEKPMADKSAIEAEIYDLNKIKYFADRKLDKLKGLLEEQIATPAKTLVGTTPPFRSGPHFNDGGI